MNNFDLKQYAYLGDSLWEIIIRKIVIEKTSVQKKMHNLTTTFVNANFQADFLNAIMPILDEEEKNLAKSARNIKLNINKKNNPQIHSMATAFEAIIGYFYLENREKFNLIEKITTEIIRDLI
jgi:ribonuclease-3 family protein